ncbi:MAG: hypothetical protein WCK90_06415, partial [archaeon]
PGRPIEVTILGGSYEATKLPTEPGKQPRAVILPMVGLKGVESRSRVLGYVAEMNQSSDPRLVISPINRYLDTHSKHIEMFEIHPDAIHSYRVLDLTFGEKAKIAVRELREILDEYFN